MLTLGEQQRQLDDILSIIVIKVLSIIVITLNVRRKSGNG
jgi:hypothetical protein